MKQHLRNLWDFYLMIVVAILLNMTLKPVLRGPADVGCLTIGWSLGLIHAMRKPLLEKKEQ
jgi:hypothetical protein